MENVWFGKDSAFGDGVPGDEVDAGFLFWSFGGLEGETKSLVGGERDFGS